ncbi:MAG: hypothetical protein FRX49_00092 [Trebouxia sp. A1-2]|nr:MAG: hypothetical protein FRX49_00092 [Trebouxia sp. A1-2]
MNFPTRVVQVSNVPIPAAVDAVQIAIAVSCRNLAALQGLYEVAEQGSAPTASMSSSLESVTIKSTEESNSSSSTMASTGISARQDTVNTVIASQRAVPVLPNTLEPAEQQA